MAHICLSSYVRGVFSVMYINIILWGIHFSAVDPILRHQLSEGEHARQTAKQSFIPEINYESHRLKPFCLCWDKVLPQLGHSFNL